MSSFLFISLRDIPLLKIFIIAFYWTYLTIIIPVLVYNISFDSNLILNIIVRFLFVLAITIPFDIRDYSVDDSSKKTIPQLIGLQKATILAVLILLALTATFCFYFHHTMMIQIALVHDDIPHHLSLYYQ